MQAQHTSRLVVLTHEDGRSRWRFASDYHDDVLRQAVVAMHADQGGAPRLSEMRRVQWAARAASVAAVTLGRDSAQFEHFLSRMGAGLEEAWLAAGRRLQANGYAVLEGFAGEEVARELRTSLAALYLKHGAEVEFSHGQIGGGRDGFGLDVRKNERIRGDRRAQLEVADERAPLLRCLFFCIDQLVGHLAATDTVPELRAMSKRSRPMLACYEANGARYIRHVDNPDDNGRLLTCIYYLNEGWRPELGGELLLFPKSQEDVITVEPLLDRLVLFWSDARTPHEVLPSRAQRLAVSTWIHHR